MEHGQKTPQDSIVHMTELVLPNDTNQLGNCLGGRLMHWIDIAAALVAMRHASKICVTASVDELNFIEPVKLGHVVHLDAYVNRAFRTSMEIEVRVQREDPINGTIAEVSTAWLTFVAIDNYGKPLPVPPVYPVTDEDKLRYENAETRRTHRLMTRKK